MRKIIFVLVTIFMLLIALCGCESKKEETDFLRIHIRANSNEDIDQDIKYIVRDKVIEYLSEKIEGVSSKEDAEKIIIENKENLKKYIDTILMLNGFEYKSSIELKEEFFPTRTYNKDLTLKEGIYEALIINLGEGKGDNWWCIVFPPLCFMEDPSKNIEYRSIIKDTFYKFFVKDKK